MTDVEHELEHDFIETQLEDRDGATWVSGLCPACWERYAFVAPARGAMIQVHCPNGHLLRITGQTTAGTAMLASP